MKTVAIVGASSDRNKFGNKAVRAFQQKGFTVFPVNPTETNIEGLTVFPSIKDVPVRPDWVTIYVRPETLLKILPEIQARGCDELWLNPGTTSNEVLALVDRLGLNAREGCSILAIGVSPRAL